MPRTIPGRLQGVLLLGALLATVAALPLGCRGKPRGTRTFGACGKSKACPASRVCVLTPGVASGQCMVPCAKDPDCPTGQRCTGRFQPLPMGGEPAPPAEARTARYCQAATVPLGGDCSGLRDGCQPGLECRHGKTCVRSCRGDADCKPEERCEPVRDGRVFGSEAPTLYRTCVAANARTGAACGPNRRPLCARDHACFRQRCVKRCTDDATCGEGRICDGEGSGAATDGDGQEAFRYCRRQVASGERCGRRPERDLACAKDHTCYRGRCRQLCETDTDCAGAEGRSRRCRRKRRRGERFRICL